MSQRRGGSLAAKRERLRRSFSQSLAELRRSHLFERRHQRIGGIRSLYLAVHKEETPLRVRHHLIAGRSFRVIPLGEEVDAAIARLRRPIAIEEHRFLAVPSGLFKLNLRRSRSVALEHALHFKGYVSEPERAFSVSKLSTYIRTNDCPLHHEISSSNETTYLLRSKVILLLGTRHHEVRFISASRKYAKQ